MAPSGTLAFQYGTGARGGKADEQGRRAFWQPRGVSVALDGSLLVADYAAHCVFHFKAGGGDPKGRIAAGEEGKALPTLDPLKDIDRPLGAPEGEGSLLKRPVDVCTDGEGGIFVLDAEDCRVQRFGLAGGSGPAATVMPAPGAPAQKSLHTPEAVKNPRAMLAAPDGALIVCDTWSHRVLRFAPPAAAAGGAPRPELLAGAPNSCGARADQLAFPSGVALDLDGALLVADTSNHRVQRFAPGEAGAATTVAGSAEGLRGSGPCELDMPTGICVDPRDGALLVADRCNARLLRFPRGARAGEPGEVLVGPESLSRPWGVCVGHGDEVFVSDERRAVVLRLEVEALVQGSTSTVASGSAAAGATSKLPEPVVPTSGTSAISFAPPARSMAEDPLGLD